MAGKKGQKGSGGARPGAGRPKKQKPDYDEAFKRRVLKAARDLKKLHGKTLEEAMLAMCFDPDVQDTVKASVFRIYAEMLTVKKSAKDVNVTQKEGPSIGLPPMRSDPAKVVPIDGGKK